tara:strand:- start:9615 stop:10487 length:873 start_codon:yes stop_codon:yes gene_type:complete
MRDQAKEYFQSLQDQICDSLTGYNGESYQQDMWERPGGGGGRTRVFSGGKLLEKGGVNFSEVYGKFSEDFAKSLPIGDGLDFYATGISLVLHPENPHVPTIHANFRYLERGASGWFGGGIDLTPYYPRHEDVIHFHSTICEALGDRYQEFKQECDKYFYLPHRQETRGVGGCFFDYQEVSDTNWQMVKKCGDAFLPSYLPIVDKRLSEKFDRKQKDFQEYRRGRYVEFNLLYDRGTVFGLKTNGRVESILMSLPKHAQWWYDHKIEPGSEEAKLLDYLKPRDWLNEGAAK